MNENNKWQPMHGENSMQDQTGQYMKHGLLVQHCQATLTEASLPLQRVQFLNIMGIAQS